MLRPPIEVLAREPTELEARCCDPWRLFNRRTGEPTGNTLMVPIGCYTVTEIIAEQTRLPHSTGVIRPQLSESARSMADVRSSVERTALALHGDKGGKSVQCDYR